MNDVLAPEAVAQDLTAAKYAGASAPPFDKRRALAAARSLLTPEPTTSPDYPTHALGPLAGPCRAIAEHGQLRPAMAGQCLLGAASLLTQGLFNVETMGGIKPLSLYLLTLGDSGEGKSTAEDAALAPVWEWQRRANAEHQHALAEAQAARSTRKKGEAEPEQARAPHRICMDMTVEGLRRDFTGGAGSQGVFTSEAAAMLAGYGMSAEHRSKTAAVLCGLWDRGLLSVSRATGGRTERHGCRLAMHWLVQPMAAAEALGDPALTAQGYWPRCLLAWPVPTPPRTARALRWATIREVGRYWQSCTELLTRPLADDATDCPVIGMDTAAQSILAAAFERFETAAKTKAGELRGIKPFALRATEQMSRIAGVLTAFAGRNVIGGDDARGALALVLHSLECWRQVIEQGAADPTAGNALRLYEWLIAQPTYGATGRAISRYATPHALRGRDTRDAALDLLEAHGLILRDGSHVWALMPTEGGHDGQP
jgi:Protein of unknown function (DUF3987)